ncbi:hypothetical protein CALCODRAFT_525591 [Calocera cornea HHB12733]|uniref:HIT-type domain-containing protein n=1 Tax=Calocera cornea HHB12733 TaxID=1353952 RepID=A0A165CZH0_9BASI|nr:hypothetical protein CALCODRAFT_525591 [Calocera cornea HHB12733]
MPPKRGSERKQPQRTTQLSLDYLARRTRRYLDELERVNYHKFGDSADDKERLAVTEGRRAGPAGKAKTAAGGRKSTMGVRQLLLYRKGLATLIDESGLKDLPASTPTYLSAAAPPPSEPRLRFCVSCGYWGAYRCQKCGDEFCSIRCGEWHRELRCGKI